MNEVFQFAQLDDAGFQMVMKDRAIYHKFMDGLSCIHDLVVGHPRFALLYIENAINNLLDGDLPDVIKENLAQNYEAAKALHERSPEENSQDFADSLSRFYTGLRLVEKDW